MCNKSEIESSEDWLPQDLNPSGVNQFRLFSNNHNESSSNLGQCNTLLWSLGLKYFIMKRTEAIESEGPRLNGSLISH